MTQGLMSEEAQRAIIEGGRRGGKAPKHFTEFSKERQREGAMRGGRATKHFSPETKARQIAGARKGGANSHKGNGRNNKEVKPNVKASSDGAG